jgi:hypothetical protein
MIGRLAVVAGLGAASVAHAGPAAAQRSAAAAATTAPDPAVAQAADANLESTADRQGFIVAAAVGGGLILGFGIDDSIGRGGAVDLRIGHVATPRTVLTLEAAFTAALHRPSTSSSTATNTSANLLAGAQYYVNPSLWLRVAGGVGIYQAHQVAMAMGKLGDLELVGPALLGGIGVEALRFRWGVFGVEVATSAMANRDGVLVASDLLLGVAFD